MDRRRLLTRIVQAFSITGFGFLAYPFFRTFVPTFGQDATREVDVSGLRAGESKIVRWLGRHVVVLRRDPALVKTVELKDARSDFSQQPAFAKNQHRSRRPDLFLAYLNCTHLGCEVAVTQSGEFECPCHSSRFDAAGRVYSDSVAAFNLEVPDYQYVAHSTVQLIKRG